MLGTNLNVDDHWDLFLPFRHFLSPKLFPKLPFLPYIFDSPLWQIHTSSPTSRHKLCMRHLSPTKKNLPYYVFPVIFKITMWRPVNMTLSCTSLYVKFTTRLNKKARPVAPVNLVLINSDRFVKFVSHLAHEKRRLPPICSRNIRPMMILWRKISLTFHSDKEKQWPPLTSDWKLDQLNYTIFTKVR